MCNGLNGSASGERHYGFAPDTMHSDIHSSFYSSPVLFTLFPLHSSPPPPLLPSFTTSTTSSRCIVCEQCLPESYYQLEEQPYCRDHYYERTAHQCQKCSDYITGPTMVGGCPFSGYRSGNETMVVMSHSQTML